MESTEETPIEGEVMKPLKRVRAVRAKAVPVPDLDSRVGKYFISRKKGKSKRESARSAGYSEAQSLINPGRIEKSKAYQELEKIHYKDKLLEKITIEQIAQAHADNILQEDDRGARNKAIEMAIHKLEPDKVVDDEDRVFVILKEE